MADFSAFKSRPCPEWYAEAGLGIFIHWGMFAVPAWAPRGTSITELVRTRYDDAFVQGPYAEWYENALRFPESPTSAHHRAAYGSRDYQTFRPEFDEAAEAFDAHSWAELFVAAGARYVVLVTKHHDGYCLWPTKVENPWRPGWHSSRDFVGELADAVRSRGMRFGLYYSGGLDWTTRPFPIGNLGDMFAAVPIEDDYRSYAGAQVRELIRRYSPSVLWNDIAWPNKDDVPAIFSDYYAAVPDGVVNDRWLGEVSLFQSLRDAHSRQMFNTALKARIADAPEGIANPPPPHCDFRTVEYSDGHDMGGKKWESTRGLGLAFGYNRNERTQDYLTGEALTSLYRDVTSRGGNLLINVGPMASGEIPKVQSDPLRELGQFIRAQ
jgi:alpha-L-fucosidase